NMQHGAKNQQAPAMLHLFPRRTRNRRSVTLMTKHVRMVVIRKRLDLGGPGAVNLRVASALRQWFDGGLVIDVLIQGNGSRLCHYFRQGISTGMRLGGDRHRERQLRGSMRG